MTLFDSHCHLGSPAYADDLEDVLQRAREAGVTQIVCIGSGYGLGGNARAVELAHAHDGMWATVGVHPHEAEEAPPDLLDQLTELAADPKVVALGEMGLDFFRNYSPHDLQRRIFRDQLRLARRLDLPVVIHARAAEEETLQILDEERAFDVPVLIHCFTHEWGFAKQVLERGGFLSVPGVITYKTAGPLRDAVTRVPGEVLLLETDGPFLSPVPHRGQRNEPAHLAHTAAEVARVRGLAERDVARASTRAARVFFRLDRDEAPEGAVAYQIRDSIYVNLTNRCTLACTFCHKFIDFTVAGHYLNLRGYRPTADEAVLASRIAAERGAATRSDLDTPVSDRRLTDVDEVAFVGFGEPTTRLDVLIDAARQLRDDWGVKRVRLDTDGLVNLRQGRDVIPQLAEVFDAVTVSVNAPDAATYAELCPGPFGESGWQAALDFLEGCVDAGIPWVQGSVVGVPELDIDACCSAIERTGARFRERVYHVVG
jgi:TatD DNase family protein